jgi:hypothetical protein
LRGFGDSALLGYRDNISAAVEPYTAKLYNAFVPDEEEIQVEPDYVKRRDAENKRTEELREQHPGSFYTGTGLGAVATALVPGVNIAKGATWGARALNAGRAGAIMGAAINPGETEGELSGPQVNERIRGAGLGAAMGMGFQAAGDGISTAVQKAPALLRRLAEKTAVNATGATGKQASEFSDDAGRELLDRGIVRFGDSQEKIAQRAGKAVDAANDQIDTALTSLDAQGVSVDGNKIRESIQNKIKELSSDPSQADIVRMLKSELENLDEALAAKGNSTFGMNEAEKIKRGYNRKAGNWADPEKGAAGKEMYQTYRGAVEDVAESADQGMSKLFKEGKESFGLLRPIEEAAERRANTTQQSPWGGLLDVASIGSAGVGAAASGDPKYAALALLSPLARRTIAPRLASSAAVTTNALAKSLQSMSPKFAEMAQKSPQAFAQMVQRLAQNPKFTPNQNPQQSPEPQMSPFMERLGNDPNMQETIQNDRLKEQLKKYQEKQNINKPVSAQEAQAQFIEGN